MNLGSFEDQFLLTVSPGARKLLPEEAKYLDNQVYGSLATPNTEDLGVNDRVQNARLPSETNQDTPSPHDSSGATSRFPRAATDTRGQAGGTPGMF